MEICAKHQGSITHIILDKTSVKLGCPECKDERLQEGQHPDSIILIQKVLRLPEVLLSKINIDFGFKSFFSNILKVTNEDLNNFKNQWVKQLLGIKNSIERLINDTINYFEILSNLLSDYRNELKRIIKFESFEKYIQANLGSQNLGQQQTSAIIQRTRHEINTEIELKIQDYINQIVSGNNNQIKNSIEDQIKDYKNKVINSKVPSSTEILVSITSQLKDFEKAITLKSQEVNPLFVKYSSLLEIKNFQDILYKITKKQNPNCSLIYQGTIDGFQTMKFWNKIQNKSNLLMILKLKSNMCVFGGYSPCQWLKTPQPQFISDDKGTSFLFIQNQLQQIRHYPIKNDCKHQAITVNQSYGPVFGQNDLQIFPDFKEGYLNIGQNYQRDPQENQQTFFIGPKLVDITECEVFEL